MRFVTFLTSHFANKMNELPLHPSIICIEQAAMMDANELNSNSTFWLSVGAVLVLAQVVFIIYKRRNFPKCEEDDLPEYPSAFLAHGLLWSGILTIIASVFSGLIGVPGYILLINATIAISGAGIIFAIRRLTWEVRLLRADTVKDCPADTPATPAQAFLRNAPSPSAGG